MFVCIIITVINAQILGLFLPYGLGFYIYLSRWLLLFERQFQLHFLPRWEILKLWRV